MEVATGLGPEARHGALSWDCLELALVASQAGAMRVFTLYLLPVCLTCLFLFIGLASPFTATRGGAKPTTCLLAARPALRPAQW